MKLRALIIDDEPLAHDVIIAYAKDIPFLEIAGQCYLATQAPPILNREVIDLVFLDINMPKIKGLDFLRTLKEPPLVIVTSAYEEYALESFELEVCDYLLKPFDFDRFLKAVNRAYERDRRKQPSPAAESSAAGKQPGHLFIKSDKRYIQLDLTKVTYLESYGNYVKIWLGKEFHLTPGTLSGFESELPDKDFFRIHKSFIINRRHIDYVEDYSVVLKDRKVLPVGKSYRKSLKGIIS